MGIQLNLQYNRSETARVPTQFTSGEMHLLKELFAGKVARENMKAPYAEPDYEVDLPPRFWTPEQKKMILDSYLGEDPELHEEFWKKIT